MMLETRRLYRQIAEQITHMITGGEFPVGSRLPSERDLAERLGVSRPSVREALIAMEVEGIVEVKVGAGVSVICLPSQGGHAHGNGGSQGALLTSSISQLYAPGPFDVIRARAIIESECAALAAIQATELHLESMRQAVLEMRRFRIQTPEGMAADQRFHLCIAEASGNSALMMTVHQLWEQRTGALYVRLESHFTGNDIWARVQLEHEELLDAIVSREPIAAKKAMAMHMKNAEIRFASGWRLSE